MRRVAFVPALLLALLTSSTAVPGAEAAAPATRVAWKWPFASTSPWNVPIGSSATYETLAAARTSNLNDTRATPWVNAGQYSIPIFKAAATDPLATVVARNGTRSQYRIPRSAQPATGTDGAMFIVDPTGRFVDETWQMQGGPTSWTTSYHVRNDLSGSGWGSGGVRAAGGSGVGGVIRKWEVDAGVVRHGLALVLTDFQLKDGPVWPATNQDAGARYSGQNPMGTLAAIPPRFDITKMGLSREGLIIAKALQDYGGYVVDRSSAFVLYAEPSFDGTPQLENMRRDLGTIRRFLRVVTNNTPGTVGGGGWPRAALAPLLPV